MLRKVRKMEKKLIEEMAKEIIDVWENKCQFAPCTGCKYSDLNDMHCQEKLIADHLISLGYRKQSENVIELPCKIGDLLYMPWEWNGQKGIACLTVTVLSCIIGLGWSFRTDFDTDDDDYYEAYNCGSFKLEDFGKTVFLTRKEAEAKMKGGAE